MIVSTRSRHLAARRAGFTLLEVLVVVAIIVILAGVAGVYVFGTLDDSKIQIAQQTCGQLEKMCEVYMLKPQVNGVPPASLQVLALGDQSNNIAPVLDGGLNAITDPWGKQYQMEVITDNFGKTAFRVSTTVGSVQGSGQVIYSKKYSQHN